MIRRFNRYELKYVIPAEVRDRLLPEMLAHTRPDKEGSSDGIYDISSLYYDSHDLVCYHAKLDGIAYRRKLRIRRYGHPPPRSNPKVMVEIKQRINRTTQKRRLTLPLDEAYRLCDGDDDRVFGDEMDDAVANEVRFLVGAQQLRPKCVISYQRRALMGSQYEPGLRITFDQLLRVSDAGNGVEDGREAISFLRPDRVILEVKSNDVIPLWVSRLLAANSCSIVRFSKYCSGIARLRALPGGRYG